MSQAHGDREEVDGDARAHGAHLAVFTLIFALYGQAICPILTGRPFLELVLPIAAVGVLQWVLRRFVLMPHEGRAASNLFVRQRVAFWSDYGLFVAGGACISLLHHVHYDQPLENVGKVATAYLALGFYMTLDLALRRERRLAALRAKRPADAVLGRGMPFTTRFILFSVLNLAVLAAACLLLVYKDVLYAAQNGMRGGVTPAVVMREVAFVVAVLAGYIVRVIVQYSDNLRLLLETKNSALAAVVAGRTDVTVPILSDDEFGRSAHMTNTMIGRLDSNMRSLAATQEATVASLVGLAAKRDNETGLHLKRTQLYIAILAQALRAQGRHTDALDDETIDLLYRCAPLHDIGKVGVPDAVLSKPGKLDDAEFAVMRTHTTIGADALAEAEAVMGGGSTFLSLAREIALTHHERWDGTGYPHGLAGEAIPLSGRLMAVADVYDALRSKRVYKPAFPHTKAAAIIREGAGTHFDPDVVRAFEAVESVFEDFSERLAEPEFEEPLALAA